METREYVVQGSLPLRRGSLMRIAGGRDLTIHVWRGTVWITQEGDPEDHFVGPGSRFRVTNAGLTLVSALQPSALRLSAPRPARFAEQIDVLRAGSSVVERLLAPAQPSV
jgi:hypothetical protein